VIPFLIFCQDVNEFPEMKNRLSLFVCIALFLCSCHPNAPKYESILDEMLSCMVPDAGDDVHLLEEDEMKLVETLRYHSGFEKAPDVRNLREYLFGIDENLMFNSADGVEALRIEKDIYGPAVDSLCAFVEEGGNFPSVPVLAAIHHLQDQYSRAMVIAPQIGIGAAIWLNRFTQQAVKYCPDIRILTDNYASVGSSFVGIIEMPEGERESLTNIIITDFNGERQVYFGVYMLVNKVAASYIYKPHFLLYGNAAPDEFEAFVLTSAANGYPEILTTTYRKENRQAVQEWMSPVQGKGDLRLLHHNECSLDLLVDKDDQIEVRTLRYEEKDGSCRFVFDPDTDISIENKPYFKDIYADLDGDKDVLLDSLSNPSSPKWDNLFSVKEGFLKEYLPGGYSHNGKLLAIADGEKYVTIADYSKRQMLPYRLDSDGSTVISVQFGPDDSQVLVQSWSGRIALFDTRTGELLKETCTKEREIDTRIAFDWDKCEGYVGHGNKLLRLRLNEGLSELVDKLEMPIDDILPYRGHQLLITGSKGLLIYNPDTKTVIRRIPFGYESFRKVALSPNKRFVLAYDPDGIITLWDTDCPDNHWTMHCSEGYGNGIGFSDDGTKFIFIDGDRKSVTERTLYTMVFRDGHDPVMYLINPGRY